MPATQTAAQEIRAANAHVSTQDDMGNSKITVEVAGQSPLTVATTRNPGANIDAKHPWERTGLGVAPYRLVGSGTMTYQACHGAPIQPGTCCDYCGQGISNVFFIKAACGSTFKVGCDCVRKVCDKREGVLTQVEKVLADRRRAATKRLNAAKKDALVTLISENAERLATMPHPHGREGETAAQWSEWMFKNCGAAGRSRMLKTLRGMLAGE